MKKILIITIITSLIYCIYIIAGFLFLEDFSEYVFLTAVIYFGIIVLNFICLHWKDNFIAEFLIEKKLNFIFIVFAIIYFSTFVITLFKSDGMDRAMYCTIWISIINVCICNYLYLK